MEYGRTISQRTKETMYADSLKWCGDKLRLRKELFQSFFKLCSEKKINHIRELLEEPNLKGTIKITLMVGGFSESEIFQKAIRSDFPVYRIVIPQEADISVLKGAVVFGHDQTTINEIIAKYGDRTENFKLVDPKTIRK